MLYCSFHLSYVLVMWTVNNEYWLTRKLYFAVNISLPEFMQRNNRINNYCPRAVIFYINYLVGYFTLSLLWALQEFQCWCMNSSLAFIGDTYALSLRSQIPFLFSMLPGIWLFLLIQPCNFHAEGGDEWGNWLVFGSPNPYKTY